MDDPRVIYTDDMRLGYLDVIKHIKQYGARTSPRGQPTLEVMGFTLKLVDPLNSVPWGIGRQLNLAIASAELTQLVGGYSDLPQLASINPRFNDFSDGGRLRGAYGPRLRDQMPWLLRRLIADRDTRQGVVTIWRSDDLEQPSRDVPCTVSLKFAIRDGCLDMYTDMRSNDVWLGMCYDVPIFTAFQRTIAHCLDVETGMYTHNVASLHLYERDLEATDKLYAPTDNDQEDKVPPFILDDVYAFIHPEAEKPVLRWYATRTLAQLIGLHLMGNEPLSIDENETHAQRLTKHQPKRRLCTLCHYTYESNHCICLAKKHTSKQ